jgi:DNA excision repair protein ERCC-2
VAGRRDEEYSMEAFAMDPSILTGILNEVHCSIHLSGTLSPMEEYRDSIGIPEDTPLVKLPPPFPRGNRLILHHRELSTNYERLKKDPDTIEDFRYAIKRILDVTMNRNTAIFFPSFDLMSRIMGSEELEDGDTLPPTLSPERDLFMERRGSKGVDLFDLVEDFKESKGGILASVLGGRLSEGMDYPGRSLEQVIVVGIPYPKPNARQRALSAYYDIKFHKGWEYTVHAPASRRLLQAIGRMIRSESDRGVGYILDRRAIHFRNELEDLRVGKDDLSDLIGFFRE